MLNSTDAIKSIRTELKKLAAVENLKISCTRQSFAGGSSITVAIMEAPQHLMTDKTLERYGGKEYSQVNHYYINEERENRYTDYGKRILSAVNDIVKKYHDDRSDSMTDYFFCNFYFHLAVGRWDRPLVLKS